MCLRGARDRCGSHRVPLPRLAFTKDVCWSKRRPWRFRRGVAVRVQLRNLDFPRRPQLHLGEQDYVQGWRLLSRAKTSRAQSGVDAGHVDSPWATPAVFPKGGAFDEAGQLLNADALDYTLWDEWIARWQGARNYCVFFAVGPAFHGEKMGTPRFATMVGSWLTAWVRHMEGKV